jgi:hypothetical protein
VVASSISYSDFSNDIAPPGGRGDSFCRLPIPYSPLGQTEADTDAAPGWQYRSISSDLMRFRLDIIRELR